jgi:hypothetical protein
MTVGHTCSVKRIAEEVPVVRTPTLKFRAGKMLQNKKAALISGGFKSFVSVRRRWEKVTE